MERGAPVSPMTMRPKRARPDPEVLAQKALEDEATLRQKADDMDLVFSEHGQKTITLITGKLEKRVAQLIREDPEALAYGKILTELGHKVNSARKAVDELYRKYLTPK